MLEGYFHVCEFAFTQIPTGEIQLFTTLPFLQAINAVVANPSAMPVIPSNYRLVSGQKAFLKTVPPPPSRDRLSLGVQNELVSWWFVPDHIHGISSSTLSSRHERLTLAVTVSAPPKSSNASLTQVGASLKAPKVQETLLKTFKNVKQRSIL